MSKIHVCWDGNQVKLALEALDEYLVNSRLRDNQENTIRSIIVRSMIKELENEAEQNQLKWDIND